MTDTEAKAIWKALAEMQALLNELRDNLVAVKVRVAHIESQIFNFRHHKSK